VLTVGLSIFFCLAVFEYGILYFLYPEPQQRNDKEFDPVLGWHYVPGSYSVKPDNSLLYHGININQFRLRGPAPRARPIRVVVLGDSFTFGRLVPQEYLFTSRLQHHLDKKFPLEFEIINAGVEGYGTAQELLLMRHLANQGLIADIYILQLFTNDILDNLRLKYHSLETESLQPAYVVDRGVLVLGQEPRLPGPTTAAAAEAVSDARKPFRTYLMAKAAAESYADAHPAFVRWAASAGIPIALPRGAGLINAWYTPDILPKGLPLLGALIKQMKIEVETQGSSLVAMPIPSPLMVYPGNYGPILKLANPQDPRVDDFLRDTSKPQRAMQQICEELQVPFVNVLPALIENSVQPLYIPRDGHLSKEGHEVVAQALVEVLSAARKKRSVISPKTVSRPN
jgi:lysophospholipase L1-like esterase